MNQSFQIESYTCTLKSKNQKSLLDENKYYIVPIYQRSYSWGYDEIRRLLEDMKGGYLGQYNDSINSEPIFIGTMQLSAGKYVSDNETRYELIDGQQRVTTLLILLKEINQLLQKSDFLVFNRLETRVNDESQKYIEEYFCRDCDYKADTPNPYICNASIIRDILQSWESDQEENNEFDFDGFEKYILNQVYFVVIETRAGLSKTIQIFNSINTAGLDLNGGDLFKIRMYEYLRDKKNEGEDSFSEISKVYDEIEKKKREGIDISIGVILSYFQKVLIIDNGLPASLFQYAWDTFFDRLFDTILGVKSWEEFSKVKDMAVEISLNSLSNLIEVYCKWVKSVYPSVEGMFAYEMMGWSRYSRHLDIDCLYLYYHKEDYNGLYALLCVVNKLLFSYSIAYAKSIYKINAFMYNLKSSLKDKSHDDLIKDVTNEISGTESWLKNELKKDIASNVKWKNMICRMSQYLFSKDSFTSGSICMDDVRTLLFETQIDIEHIHATADTTINWNDEELQNGIGNLTMLEYDINRRIQNKPYMEKRKEYKYSAFPEIKNIAESNEKWTMEEAVKRRDIIVDTICDYIIGR